MTPSCGEPPKAGMRALWHTTDLLIAGRYSDDEIWTFGEVIGRLADEIEVAARAQLAKRLARFDKAPVNIIHKLAFDDSIDVAGPVLRESERLETLCPGCQRLHQRPAAFARDLETKVHRGGGHGRAGDARQPGGRELGRQQQWCAFFGLRLPAHDPTGRRRFHPRRATRPAQGHPPASVPAADRKGVGRREKAARTRAARPWSTKFRPR